MINEKLYDYVITAAGRVNLIGEHIDYCGGKVFPAALSFRNAVYVRANGTDKINLSWTTLPDKVSLNINQLQNYKNLKYGNYQAGSAYLWQRAGHKVIGCDMLHDCTVPFGSGLSSSAAIEVSTIAALATIAGEKINPVEIALIAQKAEREYAGVNCGIMDQYASACGKKDCAMLLDCSNLNCKYVPLNLKEYSLIITNSNKPHDLIESKYNERRAETEEGLAILKKHLKINCLAELSKTHLEKHKNILPSTIYNRVKHVVEECERDIILLGKLLNASHKSLKELYEVTGYELDSLAYAAQNHPSCVGSRMTGGGFGGCTVSLVKSTDVENFKNYVKNEYNKATGYNADFYDASVAEGITVTRINK